MKDLLSLAQGYLGAEGWDVKARGRDLLRGDRDSRRGDDEKDYVYVWVPADVGGDFTSREGPYLRRFEEAREEHPTAEKVFLVPTLEGLSSDFRSGARRWHGVKILVPAQFFDSDFKWERDERAASATSELRRRGAQTARKRIAQPFHVVRAPIRMAAGTTPTCLTSCVVNSVVHLVTIMVRPFTLLWDLLEWVSPFSSNRCTRTCTMLSRLINAPSAFPPDLSPCSLNTSTTLRPRL